jgi:ABC-type lipoprotein export system ATPase subunit
MTQQHPTSYHHLRWLSVVGGFMDGARIEFGPGLNCIIGARGTGKTTVLELIRFALDAMPDDLSACKRIESLVSRNLDFGRVELGIETKDGLAYVVSRAADEEPVILTEDGKPTGITLKAGSFFKADVFSQNEVESIADRSLSQLELIDNFEAERIAEINTQLKRLGVELTANANGIQPLQEKIAALGEELAALPGIEEKLKGYSATSGTDGAAIDEAHAQKGLRDRENRATQRLTERMDTLGNDLKALIGVLDQETQAAISRDILEGPNKGIFTEILRSMQDTGRDVDGHLARAKDALLSCWNLVQEQSKALTTTHTAQEMAFRTLIEKHQAAMGQATERSRLEKARNDLLAKKRERDEAAERLNKLQDDRVELMKRLSEHRDARFKVREEVAERINQSLSPSIRVSIMQDGNPERYAALLEEALRGGRLKQGQVAQKIVNAMWPADLVKIARDRDTDSLVNKAELNPDQAAKTIAALVASGRLKEIETVELIDQPRIELKDGENYKDSQSLSTGQKCTTILPILLMESEKPLLVDQPEDNLDNRFISQTVVESLHKVKQRRQLVFVTHNPNIPVLGDAEKVFVLESDGTHAGLVKDGTVDECKKEIVTLLEGGEKAFKQRKERYKY